VKVICAIGVTGHQLNFFAVQVSLWRLETLILRSL